MRRLSAFLMIAALVAAVVPSATLAAKPVPVITNVSVQANGGTAPTCLATWWVYFSGRAYEARITPIVASQGSPELTFRVDNKFGKGGFYGPVVGLATNEYTWKAELLDRKGKVLGSAVTTIAETWTDETSCPGQGNLAGWPPELYEN